MTRREFERFLLRLELEVFQTLMIQSEIINFLENL